MPTTTGGHPAERTPVPRLRDVSARFAALENRKAELQVEINSLTDEQNQVWTALAAKRGETTNSIDRRVGALLSGLVEQEATETTDSRDLGARYSEIEREIFARRRAMVELDKLIASERIDASRQVCIALEGRHHGIAQRMVSAVAEMFAAYREYDAFASELDAKDIAWVGQLSDQRPHWIYNDSCERTSMPARYLDFASYRFNVGTVP